MRKTTTLLVMAGATALLMALGATTVFACTILPSTTINQPAGIAGSAVQITGTSWTPNLPARVAIHWDALNGPVLAQASTDATGSLGPVSVAIPATAQPGYHILLTEIPGSTASVTRTVFQVVGTGSGPVRLPQAILPGTVASSQTGVGVGTAALLASMGIAGIVLLGAGTASLVHSRRRIPVPTARRR